MSDEHYRHQVDLERLKADLVKRYGPLPTAVVAELQELLQKLGVASMAELTQAQQEKLLAAVNRLTGREYDRQATAFAADLERLAASEARWEAAAMQAGGIVKATAATAEQAWRRARRAPLQATGELLDPLLANLSARAVVEIEREIRIAIAQGRNLTDTVAAVIGTRAARYSNGALARAQRNTESLVRTATQHVSQQGRHATWVANDVERWRFLATLDGRTSIQCRALDGRTFPVGEGPEPPLHIRCRSTTIPDLPDEGGTRASEDGPVAGTLNYYQWLKRQPAAYQDEILGKTRGALLRNGGLTAERFAALQLDKNFRPLTLAEMERREPQAFRRAGLVE